MASLRTAFLQHANFTTFTFESIIGIVRPFPSSSTNPDQKKFKKNQKKVSNLEIPKKQSASQILRVSSYQKSLFRMINLNINTLKGILDDQSNDFKDSSNLVHVLDLQEDPTYLQELETENSVYTGWDNDEETWCKWSDEDESSEVEDVSNNL